MEDRRERHAEEDGKERIFESRDKLNESVGMRERGDGGFDNGDSDEEHAESKNDGADMSDESFVDEQGEYGADKENERGIGADVERRDLSGNRRSDISAHDDADSLHERHEP